MSVDLNISRADLKSNSLCTNINSARQKTLFPLKEKISNLPNQGYWFVLDTV